MEVFETVTIPAGTLIKIEGMPFRTIDEIVVEGRESNLKLAFELASQRTG